jgi:hypothetical protein
MIAMGEVREGEVERDEVAGGAREEGGGEVVARSLEGIKRSEEVERSLEGIKRSEEAERSPDKEERGRSPEVEEKGMVPLPKVGVVGRLSAPAKSFASIWAV